MPNNAVASNAVDVSLAYVNSSNDMYTAINERMNIEKALAAQLEKVLMTADEASALMLDLSYLEGNNPSIETLIGAGTAIDNKLLTMNDSFIELAETDNATQSASIIEDLEYQLSNLQVDKDYVNRLATGVDDGGTIASFNEQYDLLMEAVNGTNGLIALQRQKLSEVDKAAKAQKEAKEALETALADINTLFDAVQKQSLDGQNAILESVQANLVRNIIVAALGLVAAIFLAVIVTRSISKPLGRINKGLSQLSKGDLSTKFPKREHDS